MLVTMLVIPLSFILVVGAMFIPTEQLAKRRHGASGSSNSRNAAA